MATPFYQNVFGATAFECTTKHDCPGNEVCAGKLPALSHPRQRISLLEITVY